MGGPARDTALTAGASVAGSSFALLFVDEVGIQRRESLPSCWDVPFERMRPSRSFPSFKGQRSFPGLWWSATTGEHVGYESWLERDVAMLLDFDPEVVGFAAQPFWLLWPGERGERRHVPDFFARREDGTGVVVEVRPDHLIDPKAATVFEATATACRQAGWRFHRTGGPPADPSGQHAMAFRLPPSPLQSARDRGRPPGAVRRADAAASRGRDGWRPARGPSGAVSPAVAPCTRDRRRGRSPVANQRGLPGQGGDTMTSG